VDYCDLINEYNLNRHIVQKREKLKHKCCTPIEPDSNFKTSWDFIGLFLILYEAIIIPYRVSFNMQPLGGFLLFEIFIDIFFIADICKAL